MAKKEAPVRAEVTDICGSGEKKYVVTRIEPGYEVKSGNDPTVVTFSIGVWQGKREPRRAQIVELFEIVAFKQGWRAQVARPVNFK